LENQRKRGGRRILEKLTDEELAILDLNIQKMLRDRPEIEIKITNKIVYEVIKEHMFCHTTDEVRGKYEAKTKKAGKQNQS